METSNTPQMPMIGKIKLNRLFSTWEFNTLSLPNVEESCFSKTYSRSKTGVYRNNHSCISLRQLYATGLTNPEAASLDNLAEPL